MTPCPFCVRIKAGDFESFSGDPTVVWFEPLNPVTPGHMLFVPVRHVEDALADPYTTAITAEIASRWWAKKWGIRSGERDCNLITSVGANATQSVRHLHVHLVPRRTADGLALPWTGQQRAETGPAAPSTTSPAAEDPDLTLVGLSPAQAYEAGVKAERERCAQLAESVGAGYEKRRPCKCGQRTCRGVLLNHHAPFADLIREGSDG